MSWSLLNSEPVNHVYLHCVIKMFSSVIFCCFFFPWWWLSHCPGSPYVWKSQIHCVTPQSLQLGHNGSGQWSTIGQLHYLQNVLLCMSLLYTCMSRNTRFQYVWSKHKRVTRTLFIWTKTICRFSGVIPSVKLENDTTVKNEIQTKSFIIVQEMRGSQGVRPELSVPKSLLVSMDAKNYWTMLRH